MNSGKSFPMPMWLILLIGIAAISFSSIFVRWSEAPVSVIAMYRLYITNLLLLPFVWKHIPAIKELKPRTWGHLFISGLALGLHFLFWMGSLRYTTVASSTAIMALEPILVMLGAYIAFKQNVGLWPLLSMITAICGALLIGWGDFGLSARALKGDLLSLLGTVAVAFHMLFGSSLRSHLSAFVYSFVVFFIAASVLAVYNAALGYPFAGYPARDWGVFLLLALVPTILGHYLFNWLLKFLKPASVSMTVLGEPVGATLLAYLLLGEKITAIQAFAGVVLLAGVWLFIGHNEAEQPTVLAEG